MGEANWVIVGRFGRAHGIKGLITIHSYTHPRDNLLNYTDWHVNRNNHWQLLQIARLDVTEKNILAQIEGIIDRDAVSAFTNAAIGISKKQLPALPSGDYYWHQLIGMQVINQSGDLLGTVKELFATGSNDVLVIEGGKRYLIPYLLEQVILSIDVEKRVISVDWDKDF